MDNTFLWEESNVKLDGFSTGKTIFICLSRPVFRSMKELIVGAVCQAISSLSARAEGENTLED